MVEASEGYKSGFKTGVNWRHGYIPGGPFASDEASRTANAEWKKGFFAGLKKCRYKKTEVVAALIASLDKD